MYEPLRRGGAKALARLLLLLLLLLDGELSHHAHAHDDGAAHEGSCALALALTPAATVLLCGLLRRRKHVAAAVALGGMVAARPALAYAAPLLLVHLLASEGFGAPRRKAKADDDTAGGRVRGTRVEPGAPDVPAEFANVRLATAAALASTPPRCRQNVADADLLDVAGPPAAAAAAAAASLPLSWPLAALPAPECV